MLRFVFFSVLSVVNLLGALAIIFRRRRRAKHEAMTQLHI